ncbi:MAG: hypothetical protein WCP55_21285, partial [Lentisphaerota bacterium]
AAKFDTNYGSKYMNPKTLYGFRNYGSTTGRVPTVYSESIYSYSNANAQLIGRLTDRGDPLAVIADIGFCFSTSTNPTILDNIAAINTFLEGDTTRFLCTLNSLSNNTPYYARAYAKNSTGTSYGANLTFTTSSSAYCEVTNSFNPTCALNISSMLTSCNGWYHVYFEYSEDCTGGTVQAAIYDESSNFIATETISGTWVSLPDSGIYYFVATGYLTTPLYNGYSIVFNHYI